MKRSSTIGVPCALLSMALPLIGFAAGRWWGTSARHMEEALQALAITFIFCLGGLFSGVFAMLVGSTKVERVIGILGAVLSAVPVPYLLFVEFAA